MNQKLYGYFLIQESAADIQRFKDKEFFLLTRFISHRTMHLIAAMASNWMYFVNTIGVHIIVQEIRKIME